MNKQQANTRAKKLRLASERPGNNAPKGAKRILDYAKIEAQAADKTPKKDRIGTYYKPIKNVVNRLDSEGNPNPITYTSYGPAKLIQLAHPLALIGKHFFERSMQLLGRQAA